VSPRDAIAAGIAIIPQELLLVSTLPPDDNVLLGREPTNRWGLIDRREDPCGREGAEEGRAADGTNHKRQRRPMTA
jgi:ABC-type sugar transport system ATPase subunit